MKVEQRYIYIYIFDCTIYRNMTQYLEWLEYNMRSDVLKYFQSRQSITFGQLNFTPYKRPCTELQIIVKTVLIITLSWHKSQ